MRLFIGIELSDQTRAAAADAAARLQEALKRARLRVDARWVPRENLHVTLWFIGEVDDERGGRIREALDAPFEIAPFTLRAHGLGAFPASGPPRVFWIGVTEGRDSLVALHARLAARLSALGFEPERRAYSAHVTIARVKDVARGAAPRVRRLLAQTTAGPGATGVEAVTLFRSRVSSKGSAYEPLFRIPLG